MRNNPIQKLLLLVTLCIFACTHAGREDTIKTALVATNAARDAFAQYDDAKQEKIVAEAKTLEEGKTALKEWRDKRNKILAIQIIVYSSILAATRLNDDASLKKMKDDLKTLLDAVTPLLGGAP